MAKLAQLRASVNLHTHFAPAQCAPVCSTCHRCTHAFALAQGCPQTELHMTSLVHHSDSFFSSKGRGFILLHRRMVFSDNTSSVMSSILQLRRSLCSNCSHIPHCAIKRTIILFILRYDAFTMMDSDGSPIMGTLRKTSDVTPDVSSFIWFIMCLRFGSPEIYNYTCSPLSPAQPYGSQHTFHTRSKLYIVLQRLSLDCPILRIWSSKPATWRYALRQTT